MNIEKIKDILLNNFNLLVGLILFNCSGQNEPLCGFYVGTKAAGHCREGGGGGRW